MNVKNNGAPKPLPDAGDSDTQKLTSTPIDSSERDFGAHDHPATKAKPAEVCTDVSQDKSIPLLGLYDKRGRNYHASTLTSLQEILQMPISFFEMIDLMQKHSPLYDEFMNTLYSVGEYEILSIKRIVSPGVSGTYPPIRKQRKIAKALRSDVATLFPENRKQKGSIVWLYQHYKQLPSAYKVFTGLLAKTLHVSEKTIRNWVSSRQVPKASTRRIARWLDSPHVQLFPSIEGKQTPKTL